MTPLTKEERLTHIREIFQKNTESLAALNQNDRISVQNKQILGGVLNIAQTAINAKCTWLGMDYTADAVKLANTYNIIQTHLNERAQTLQPYELASHAVRCLAEAPHFSNEVPALKKALDKIAKELKPAYDAAKEERRLSDNTRNEELASRTLTGVLWCSMYNGLSTLASVGQPHVPDSVIYMGLLMAAYQYMSSDYRTFDERFNGFKNFAGPAFNNSGITYCFNTIASVAEKGAMAIANRVNHHMLEGADRPAIEGGDRGIRIEELPPSPPTQRRIGFSRT